MASDVLHPCQDMVWQHFRDVHPLVKASMTLQITTSYHQTKAKSELRLKKARAVVLKQSFDLRRPPPLPGYGLATLLGCAPTCKVIHDTPNHCLAFQVRNGAENAPGRGFKSKFWPQASSTIVRVWFGNNYGGCTPYFKKGLSSLPKLHCAPPHSAEMTF